MDLNCREVYGNGIFELRAPLCHLLSSQSSLSLHKGLAYATFLANVCKNDGVSLLHFLLLPRGVDLCFTRNKKENQIRLDSNIGLNNK